MPRLPATILFLMVLVPALAPAPAALAEPPSAKSFRHWTAACDNQRRCSAFGFATLLDETMTGAWIRLDRGGGGDDAPSIEAAFATAEGGDDTPASLTLSERGGPSFGPIPVEEADGFYRAVLPAADVPAVLKLLRSADFLAVAATTSSGGAIEATLSLDGASAALLWIDDEQQRLDTVTALVRQGTKPAAAVPPVRALPVVTVAPATREVEQVLPAAIRDLASDGDCADTMDRIEPIVGDLGGGRMLYGALCGAGAYNFAAQFWIVAGGATPAPATFPVPRGLMAVEDDGDDPETLGILVNPFFDEKSMSVHSFAKGRGFGDCGSEGEWAWDGSAFRLVRYALMIECEGVPSSDWPVLYRATVR